MKLQVLVATMNQKDFSLIDKMNLNSDTIFANQSDCMSDDITEKNNHTYRMITTKTRGVGKNRNIALTYASEDICLLADDDMLYCDDYEQIIVNAFEKNPDADAIIFNIETVGRAVKRRMNNSVKKVNLLNFQNYGAVRLAFKREAFQKANVCFSELFGGGTYYSHGEDSLFIRKMLNAGMTIYTSPEYIGTVNQEESSWFNGYGNKFFYDQGVLMKAMFPRMSIIYINIYYPLRFSRIAGKSPTYIAKWMRKGAKDFVKKGITVYEEEN